MALPLKRYLDLLFKYLRPHWLQVLFLSVLLLSNIGLALINPQLISSFIDTVRVGGAMQILINTALLFLGIAFVKQAVAIYEGYVAENVSQLVTNRIRSDLVLHCLQLDPSFHTSHTPGELIERVDGDVALLGNFFSRFLVSVLGNILLLIGVLIMLFGVDWRIGLTLTLFCIVNLVIMDRVRNIGVKYWEAERQSSAELFGFVEERLAGTEDIRSSGAVPYMLHGLAERSRERLRTVLKAMQMSYINWGMMPVLFTAGSAVALVLGVFLFREGTITIGTVYLIFGYTYLMNEPIQQIINQMRDLQQTSGSIKRVLDLFEEHSVIVDGKKAVPASPLSLEFDDVSFSYVENIPVLKQISLSLPTGTVMGLLGRTGSGKSTITKLITRLYDPTQGVIRVGDSDLHDLRLDDLRNSIGMVSQEVHILHASIRDNLTLFDPTITDEKIMHVLNEMGLLSWYEAQPEGLDTKLAPGGSGLSAGEAQLIAFARVFLRDPRIVILDEASSRLDPATERWLEHAIDRLLEGRTGIIIAHRLSTVLRADIIMILEDGHCREYGSREELARDPHSRFAQLLRTGLEEALV